MAAICMLIYPDIFRHYEYGVSYFGSVGATAVPYYLGFALTILFTGLVAKKLQSAGRKQLSLAFWAFTACMVGIAATSYSVNSAVYAIHWGFAIALTVCILGAIVGLTRRGGLALLDYVLISLIVTTVVVSTLPLVRSIPVVKIYIPREILVFVCSLWLMGRAALNVRRS